MPTGYYACLPLILVLYYQKASSPDRVPRLEAWQSTHEKWVNLLLMKCNQNGGVAHWILSNTLVLYDHLLFSMKRFLSFEQYSCMFAMCVSFSKPTFPPCILFFIYKQHLPPQHIASWHSGWIREVGKTIWGMCHYAIYRQTFLSLSILQLSN